ncbi:UNVERIFIED_CONTAM: hypothetical protein Sradi_5704100, partial [Sesamum radiatum]
VMHIASFFVDEITPLFIVRAEDIVGCPILDLYFVICIASSHSECRTHEHAKKFRSLESEKISK